MDAQHFIERFNATPRGSLFAWITGCMAVAGCARSTKPLELIVTGDTAGWIVPCGCASNQSGGLPRRASMIADARRTAEVIVVDVGGAGDESIGPSTPYQQAQLEAILIGERAMNVAAHNLGASEVRLGAEAIETLGERTGAHWVSANAHLSDGTPLAPSHRLVQATGRKIAIIGVISPRYATADVRIEPPREAVLRVLDKLKGDAPPDAMIVLAYVPDGELQQLAADLPEVDCVVGGPTGQPLPPEYRGPVLIGSATNKGKFVLRLRADADNLHHWSGEIAELDDHWSDDREQLVSLQHYYDRLGQLDFTADEVGKTMVPLGSVSRDNRIAGTSTCRRCHTLDAMSWDDSAHAHAWHTLESKGTWADPACQACHTTGYGMEGGFLSARRSPRLVNVGCESCHGPSHDHAKNPRHATAWAGHARDQCLACHDRENSPDFDYAAYWPRITHGESIELPAIATSGSEEER